MLLSDILTLAQYIDDIILVDREVSSLTKPFFHEGGRSSHDPHNGVEGLDGS